MSIFNRPGRAILLAGVTFLITLSGQAAGITTYADLTSAIATGFATNFASVATIGLSTSQETLQITKNTIIDGGTNNVIIDGSSATRLFVVHTNCQLILANVQLRHGLSGMGGAIFNSGTLIISNCIFFANAATNLSGADGIPATTTNAPDGGTGQSGGQALGGAVFSYGPLFIYNSLFSTNSAIGGNGGDGGAGVNTSGNISPGFGGNAGNGGSALGGAIYSVASNNVIVGSEFLGNTSEAGNGGIGGAIGNNASIGNFGAASGQGGGGGAGSGGGVYVTGSLTASNCAFISNIALGGASEPAAVAYNGAANNGTNGGAGSGGGLYVSGAAPLVDLENCVMVGNICGGGGGGNDAGNATSGNGGIARGGGAQINAVSAFVRNCTMATNLLFPGTNGLATGTNGISGVSGASAGWDINVGAGITKAENSIFAGKSANAGGVTDEGYNLCSDQSLAKVFSTTRVGINPQLDSGLSYQGPPLGPEGINGQARITLAVPAGPATNAISGVPGISFPATDERGQARGTPATIGAFESHTITPAPSTPATITAAPQNQQVVIGGSASFSVNAATNASDPNPLGYQWQLNGVDVPNGGNFVGGSTQTLGIKNVAQSDLGSYTVIVSSSTLDSVTNVGPVFLLAGGLPIAIQTQPASRLNAPDGAVVTFKVKVSGAPPFTYQWRSNGAALTDGNEFSGSQTTNLTINPATFGDAASYSVIVNNASGRSVTSAVARLTIATDKAKPTLTISSPTAGSRTLTNAIYGTTTDNAQVTAVTCWITNIVNRVTNVTTASAIVSQTGTTTRTWGLTNALPPGTNIVAVQATDFSGNVSAVVSRKFFYAVPTVFSLTLSGPGRTTATVPFPGGEPATNGAMLYVGENYTLTAVPDPNSLLTNWMSASFTSYSNKLQFTMTPGLAIQANFVASPFQLVAGGYNGLFLDTNGGFNEAESGMLSGLTLGKLGTYSGKLLLAGVTYPITGTFDIFGHSSNYIARAAAKGGSVGLNMNLDYSVGKITGEVTGISGGWTTPLNAEENEAAAGASSFESTILLSTSLYGQTGPMPPDGTGITPPGYGYVIITNHAGALTMTGALPDGTALSEAVPLGKFGHAPLYQSLYTQKGILIGWVTLTNPTPETPGGFDWTRPAAKSAFYPDGFTNLLAGAGSGWTNDLSLTLVSSLFVTNVVFGEYFGGLTVVGASLIGNGGNGPDIKGTVNLKTGLVKLVSLNPDKGPALPGTGVILENSGQLGPKLAGYFVTKTNAGGFFTPGAQEVFTP